LCACVALVASFREADVLVLLIFAAAMIALYEQSRWYNASNDSSNVCDTTA